MPNDPWWLAAKLCPVTARWRSRARRRCRALPPGPLRAARAKNSERLMPLEGGNTAVSGGEREFCAQAGSRSAGAVEEDPAAEGLHAVLEAGQAGAFDEVGAAGAVVADREAQDGVGGVRFGGDRDG